METPQTTVQELQSMLAETLSMLEALRAERDLLESDLDKATTDLLNAQRTARAWEDRAVDTLAALQASQRKCLDVQDTLWDTQAILKETRESRDFWYQAHKEDCSGLADALRDRDNARADLAVMTETAKENERIAADEMTARDILLAENEALQAKLHAEQHRAQSAEYIANLERDRANTLRSQLENILKNY